jgi:hypothetical protein
MIDTELLKLQYEILNFSAEDIAKQTGMPISIIEAEIKNQGWKQWWPDDTPFTEENPEDELDPREVFALQSEQYIDKAKRRLAVYTLAKEIHLAQKYLALESSLVKKATDIVEGISDADAEAAGKMATLYKNMTTKNPMAALQSISFGEDEGGIPTVIVRNLTGSRTGLKD